MRLAYNQAPDVAFWWLDSYFDFNSQQSPRVRDELTRIFAWHRGYELPKYLLLIKKAQDIMPTAVSPQQACSIYDEVRGHLDTIANKALPAMAELALTMSPDQLEHIRSKYQKNNEEYIRDYLQGTEQERADKRLKQAISRSEAVYGKLEEAQIQAIKIALKNSIFDPVVNHKERQRRQKDVLDMLSNLVKTQPSAQVAQLSIRAYFNRTLSSPEPSYRVYADKMTRQMCESFASVHGTTTPVQRAKAAQTLQGYAGDLQALVAQQ